MRTGKQLDPNEILRSTIEEALSKKQEELVRLKENVDLETLGGRIHRWFERKLNGIDTDDLFQDYNLKVLGRLRRQGGCIKEPWFWTVARTMFINHYSRVLGKRSKEESLTRKEDGSSADLEDELAGNSILDSNPWSESQTEEVNHLVLECITELPPRMREFLYLDLVLRLPKGEIMKFMGLEPKSFAANKAKAIKRLRESILDKFNSRV